MNTLRVLANLRVWGPVFAMVAVLALVFYAYLGAVVSPEENLEDLPIALVNEDRGGELAGEDANLGDRVIEKVAGPDSPAVGTVDGTKFDTSGEALKGIGNGEYYHAIVIPGDGGYIYNLRVPTSYADGTAVKVGDRFTVRVRPFGNEEASMYVVLKIK
jgi:uncharacterized phage infection (PIP) family protein YhgE